MYLGHRVTVGFWLKIGGDKDVTVMYFDVTLSGPAILIDLVVGLC